MEVRHTFLPRSRPGTVVPQVFAGVSDSYPAGSDS